MCMDSFVKFQGLPSQLPINLMCDNLLMFVLTGERGGEKSEIYLYSGSDVQYFNTLGQQTEHFNRNLQ